MTKKARFIIVSVLVIAVIVAAVNSLHGHTIAVFAPAGVVAHKERNLIIISLVLSLIVVVPVFVMLFGFAWKYRESNKKAIYQPDWDHSRKFETIWWLVPMFLILILAVITWNSSHDLDPYKQLVSNKQPLQVQVVALDWKWLFIYPQEHFATVNFVEFPVNTPVHYTITSDAPMNSFWIPQLGGQIYAMSGMSTQLSLMASKTGDFKGSSANISGQGFAGMKFIARSVTDTDFDNWLAAAKKQTSQLDATSYAALAEPSQDNPVAYYGNVSDGLFDSVIMKYLAPGGTMNGMGM